MCGDFDSKYLQKCKYRNKFFDKQNNFINVPKLEYTSIYDHLIENNKDTNESKSISDFLITFLNIILMRDVLLIKHYTIYG